MKCLSFLTCISLAIPNFCIQGATKSHSLEEQVSQLITKSTRTEPTTEQLRALLNVRKSELASLDPRILFSLLESRYREDSRTDHHTRTLKEQYSVFAQIILDAYTPEQLRAKNPLLILMWNTHSIGPVVQQNVNPIIMSLMVTLFKHEPKLVHAPATAGFSMPAGTATPLVWLIELYRKQYKPTTMDPNKIIQQTLIQNYIKILIKNGALLNNDFTEIDTSRKIVAFDAAVRHPHLPTVLALLYKYESAEFDYRNIRSLLHVSFFNQVLIGKRPTQRHSPVALSPTPSLAEQFPLPKKELLDTPTEELPTALPLERHEDVVLSLFPVNLVHEYCAWGVFRLPTTIAR